MSKWFGKKIAKKFSPMLKHVYLTLGEMSKAFYEKYGEDALPIIVKVSEEAGLRSGELARSMIKGGGMKAIGELIDKWVMMDFPVEILELTDNMVHFKISNCPLGLENTSRELCEAMMHSDSKMMSIIAGFEVDMKIVNSVADGSEYCEVIFSRKKKS